MLELVANKSYTSGAQDPEGVSLMESGAKSEIITLKTSHGTIAVEKKNLINFPEGMYGFEEYCDFAFFDIKGCKPFRSMLSVQEGGPDFVIVEPGLIFNDYNPLDALNSLDEIGLGDPLELVILAIVTIAENPEDITVNLRGPIFFNLTNRQAQQIILPDETYSTKTPIMIEQDD